MEQHEEFFKFSNSFQRGSQERLNYLSQLNNRTSSREQLHHTSENVHTANGLCFFGQSIQLKSFPDQVIPVHQSPKKPSFDRLKNVQVRSTSCQKGQHPNNVKLYKLRNSLKERQFGANQKNPQMIIGKCKIISKDEYLGLHNFNYFEQNTKPAEANLHVRRIQKIKDKMKEMNMPFGNFMRQNDSENSETAICIVKTSPKRKRSILSKNQQFLNQRIQFNDLEVSTENLVGKQEPYLQ